MSTPRCKAMRDMPFLGKCGARPEVSHGGASLERNNVPLYVATDENNEAELKVLHDAGCLTAKNLPGEVTGDPILTFLVEQELLIRAESSYSYGCSTTTTIVQRARKVAGASPTKLFDPSLLSHGRWPFKGVNFDQNIAKISEDCR